MAKLRVDKIAAPIIKDEYTGSVYFDGTGDYLSMSDSSDFDLGISNEPFTWELWFYKTAAAGTHCELGVLRGGGTAGWNATNGHQYRGFQYTDNKLYWQWWNGSTNINIISSLTPAINTWHHFAVSYDGTTTRAFLNGVIFGTSTEAYAKPSASNITRIGQDPSNSVTAHGYHSNVRICKGHAVYTENFTPPTRELEVHTGAKGVVFPAADNRTVLLACQDAYNPLTEATGRHTITGAGNLGGVPGKNLVTNGQFSQNTNNWTADADATLTVSSQALRITVTSTAGATQTISVQSGARYVLTFDAKTDGTNFANFQINNNGTFLYNGNITSTGFEQQVLYFTASSSSITIKPYKATSGWAEFDNISISAVHPSTEANPGLLRKTNITSTITETTGSVYFDGSGDYLQLDGSSDFAFGTGDFNIELWVYIVDSSHTNTLYDSRPSGSNGNQVALFYSGSSNAVLLANNGTVRITGTVDIGDSKWHHISLSRQNGVTKLYVDGVQDGSYTDSTNYENPAQRPFIGASGGSTNLQSGTFTEGYISNLRICKGHAVYTSNFIPPSRELEVHEGPDDDRTVLLCCYDAENIFADKTGRHVLAAYGDRSSTPTPASSDSPIGSTTVTPGLTREVDPTEGPTFGGGAGFTSQNWLTLPKGTTAERMPVLGGIDASNARGVFAGGYSTSNINYIQISTLGNSSDFGERSVANFARPASVSSSTRGLFGGGFTSPSYTNAIDYITISSTGDGKDFGDMMDALWARAGCSNSVRGIIAGGSDGSNTNLIEHLTISTTGNTQDFGDLTRSRREMGGSSSTTRGIFMGGRSPVPSGVNNDEDIIDYITIASTGNAVDFGNLAAARTAGASCSNATRSLYSGGNSSNAIEFVTIATLGNAVDFGDMSNALNRLGSCASSTRGIIAGGSPTNNTIEYVTIATTGDAQEFGDLSQAGKRDIAGLSNGHGGLG